MLQNKIVHLIFEDVLLNYSGYNQDKNVLYLERTCIDGDCNESKIYFKSEKKDLNLFIKKFLIYASNNDIKIEYIGDIVFISVISNGFQIYNCKNANEIEAFFIAFNWIFPYILDIG